MKKITLLTLTFSILLACFVFCAYAESVSISMSCTIPAIPGVNAPLVTQESAQNNAPLTQEKKETESPIVLEEENNEILLADGRTQTSRVRTIYSR